MQHRLDGLAQISIIMKAVSSTGCSPLNGTQLWAIIWVMRKLFLFFFLPQQLLYSENEVQNWAMRHDAVQAF